MISRENIFIHELIGLKVRVVGSACREFVGLNGRVVDETKNTVVLEEKGVLKRIPKKTCLFRFYLPEGSVDVEGAQIAYRPEDRPKKLAEKIIR